MQKIHIKICFTCPIHDVFSAKHHNSPTNTGWVICETPEQSISTDNIKMPTISVLIELSGLA